MIEILLASGAVALVSLVGIFIFGQQGYLSGTRRYIVPFAIGTFLGVVFFELIPEALADNVFQGAVAIAVGFLGFYILSHWLHTYHHHHSQAEKGCDPCEASRGSAIMLLIGDAIHNFTDGIVIAVAFLVNPIVGWATTLGVALHEVPQEIAEFGVLRRAGYSTSQAAWYNLLSASSVIVGALVTLFFATFLLDHVWLLIGLAAGNLLYVATSDLLPDAKAVAQQEGHFYRSFLATVLGLVLIVAVITWSHELAPHEHGQSEHHDHDHNHH